MVDYATRRKITVVDAVRIEEEIEKFSLKFNDLDDLYDEVKVSLSEGNNSTSTNLYSQSATLEPDLDTSNKLSEEPELDTSNKLSEEPELIVEPKLDDITENKGSDTNDYVPLGEKYSRYDKFNTSGKRKQFESDMLTILDATKDDSSFFYDLFPAGERTFNQFEYYDVEGNKIKQEKIMGALKINPNFLEQPYVCASARSVSHYSGIAKMIKNSTSNSRIVSYVKSKQNVAKSPEKKNNEVTVILKIIFYIILALIWMSV